jgi:D-alanine-D-alanine ligase
MCPSRPLAVPGDASKLDIVLLADRREFSDSIDLTDRYLEFTEPDYFEELCTTLSEVGQSLTHYEDPRDFIDNIQLHRQAVVLSVWSGEQSRNRRGLIPAICEAYSLRYVGADAFAQLVCADKSLSKVFSRRYGLSVPDGVLLVATDAERQFQAVECLRFPVIVKPNAEGGSIGISMANLVHSPDEAIRLGRELLTHYETVLVEEFVTGREVSMVFAGNRDGIYMEEVLEVELVGGPAPLHSTVFGYEAKNYEPYEVQQTLARDLVDTHTLAAGRSLFHGLGKVEVMRIDGRIDASGFKVIELSPDAHLGSICLVAAGFHAAGWSYTDMLRMLLLSSAAG